MSNEKGTKRTKVKKRIKETNIHTEYIRRSITTTTIALVVA